MHNRLLLTAASIALLLLSFPHVNFAQAPALGVASTFALFTSVGAFNGDAATTIIGDIGTNAGAFTPPGFHVGQIHVSDPTSAQAAADLGIAYGSLAGLTCNSVLTTPLGNAQVLLPNIYCIGTAAVLNGDLILDGQGNPSALFIFQIDGALSTNPFSNIILINSANLCNVYFQINGAFNVGNNTFFQGTALVNGAINLGNGATLIGRGLSTSGAISTSANQVQLPTACTNTQLPPPTITCVANITVACANLVPVASTASVTATSTCPGTVTITFLGDAISNQTCANRFTVTRTYRATDACGNSATCSQTITVFDSSLPMITCPAPVTVQCASQVPAPNPASATTSDNCGGTVTVTFISDVITNQTCANRFTITRTYRATDACANSATCTQIITVFDNTAPLITCPVNVTVQCASLVPAVNTAGVTTSDNCGGAVTVTLLSEVITNQTCINRFTLTRIYRATDVCGNSATCAQIITVFDNTAPVFVNPPANVTVECLLIPGVILPTATDNCAGNVTVTFLGEVQTAGVCPVLYTLTRTFRATDACGNSSSVSQVITVIDVTPPQFTIDPVDVILECDSTNNLDSLQSYLDDFGGSTVFDCSDVTITVVDLPFSTNGCGGTFRRNLRFLATDECGNTSFRDVSFTVVDFTPPVFTVLPQNLEVECMPDCNGEAELHDWLNNFGNAEVNDACGSVTTAILFLGEKPGCGNTFIRSYEFRATDECGNTNYVRATFAVVDTTPPVILVCPPGGQLSCVLDVPGPDLASIIASDNCGSTKITVTTLVTGTGCPYWPMTVSYWYMATDECGNMTSSCDVTFQIVDKIAPTYNGPDTIEVVCVDDLPGLADITSILAPYMNDSCTDIICIGKVVAQNGLNSVTYSVSAKDFCGNFGPKFTVTFVATGNCKPLCTAPQNMWGNKLATMNGVSMAAMMGQIMAQHGGVTAGKFGKTMTVTNADCLTAMLQAHGNTDQLDQGSFTFGTANNCLESSPLLNSDGTLKNELVASVMTLQLNIWYNLEFNDRNLGMRQLGSLPPCLVDPIVLAKLDSDHSNLLGLLNLANEYLAGAGAFPPDFGDLLSEALDNLNNYWMNCQENLPGNCTNATVAGAIKTETGIGLHEAKVDVAGSGDAIPTYSMFSVSEQNGSYSFSNAIPVNSNLLVTPTKDDNPLNGVSTYDLVLISRHILGLEPLGSPYEMIAADANKSGSITTFDIVELRKMILGIYQELPNNTSWRFVDKSFSFPDQNNPFQTAFPENKTVASIQGSQMYQNFVAVKVGDVNQSAIANAQQAAEDRTTGTLLLDVEDRQVKAGESFEVNFSTAEATQGYQFTLNLSGLTVTEIAGGAKVSAENFGVFLSAGTSAKEGGALTASVDGAQEFTVRFTATKAGALSQMLSLSSQITKAEAYVLVPGATAFAKAMAVKEVALHFRNGGVSTISGLGFELYQNQPNPFVNSTLIGFHLPEVAQATLTVFDVTGKLVHTQKGDFAQGYNTIVLDGQLFPSKEAGLLYYKLETATNTATRKMIQAN